MERVERRRMLTNFLHSYRWISLLVSFVWCLIRDLTHGAQPEELRLRKPWGASQREQLNPIELLSCCVSTSVRTHCSVEVRGGLAALWLTFKLMPWWGHYEGGWWEEAWKFSTVVLPKAFHSQTTVEHLKHFQTYMVSSGSFRVELVSPPGIVCLSRSEHNNCTQVHTKPDWSRLGEGVSERTFKLFFCGVDMFHYIYIYLAQFCFVHGPNDDND